MSLMQNHKTKRLVLECCGIVFKLENVYCSPLLTNSFQEFTITVSFYFLMCLDLIFICPITIVKWFAIEIANCSLY